MRVQTHTRQCEPFAAGAASACGSFLEDELFQQYVGEVESSAVVPKSPCLSVMCMGGAVPLLANKCVNEKYSEEEACRRNDAG